VERVESTPLSEPLEIAVAPLDEVGLFDASEAFDWFAPASFAELTDAEAINRRSFERLPAGLRLGGEQRVLSEGHREKEVEAQLFVKPERRSLALVASSAFPGGVAEAALSRGLRTSAIVTAELGLAEESWSVFIPGEEPQSTASETAAHQVARYQGGVALPEGDAITVGDI
jgi:hypothetical protein